MYTFMLEVKIIFCFARGDASVTFFKKSTYINKKKTDLQATSRSHNHIAAIPPKKYFIHLQPEYPSAHSDLEVQLHA